MQVPLVDLRAQYATIRQEIQAALQRVIDAQAFILGPEVEALEQAVAEYCRCRYAVGVSSGSDALLCSLMAVGIGPGDEVIVPTFTFFATAGAVARLGARPVFVDIEPETYNIDPAAAAAAVTPRTRAIIPVHLFGQCAEMGPILELARRRGLHVIEDAAQAIGAEQAGRRAGSFGKLGCLSFFPSKNLGGFGDGGMIVTNDADLADRCRSLRVHGSQTKQQYRMVGGNFRLDALQAAVLRAKLAHLPDWTQARRRHARRYDQLLGGTTVGTPSVRPYNKMVYNQYVVRVRGRDALQRRLAECGVGTGVYYRRPLHLEECFAGLGYRPGDMPVAEQAASEVLALPIYPELTAEQQDYVVARLLELVEQPLEAREAGS